MPILIANLVACFFIGVISAPTIEGSGISPGTKLFLVTGMMGGLSTFSSFIWGTHQMLAIPAGMNDGRSLPRVQHDPRVYACQTGIETR